MNRDKEFIQARKEIAGILEKFSLGEVLSDDLANTIKVRLEQLPNVERVETYIHPSNTIEVRVKMRFDNNTVNTTYTVYSARNRVTEVTEV